MKHKITHLILASSLIGTSAQAADITWGAATAVNDVNDISTTGFLVEAINANDGTVGSVTANGVTFTNGSLLSNANGRTSIHKPRETPATTKSSPTLISGVVAE